MNIFGTPHREVIWEPSQLDKLIEDLKSAKLSLETGRPQLAWQAIEVMIFDLEQANGS